MDNSKKEVLNLIGKAVSFKRIAGNSIILYFGGDPGDANIQTLWIDPYWAYECGKKLIVSSEDFPWEKEAHQTDEEFKAMFERVCAKSDGLIKSEIVNIEIQHPSNNISLIFDNDQVIRNSINLDEIDAPGWIYSDRLKDLQISAYFSRLEATKIPVLKPRE